MQLSTMQWRIEGGNLKQARSILKVRFDRDEMELAMSDLSIDDPGFPPNLPLEIWMGKVFDRFNRTLELPRLFTGLAERMGGAENEEARELLEIVKKARPVRAPSPQPDEDPPPLQNKKTHVEPQATTLSRIILLGESTAISASVVTGNRKALHDQLAKALKDTKICVVDWDDMWNGRQAKAAEPEDARALFVRVVNTDTLNEDLEPLISLPRKLGQKLKLQGAVNASQIVIWNCDGGEGMAKNGNGIVGQAGAAGEPRHASGYGAVRTRLDEEKLLLAEDPIDQFLNVIRSRLRLEKWPPALNLEHPGENKLIETKLIEVIMSRTKEICKPPYPEMLYLEVTEEENTDNLTAELEGILSGDAPRDGLIIAIHDLNLDMTDDPKEAIWRVQERVKQYDGVLAPIIKTRGISEDKVIKLAVIMNAADKLPRGRYPYSWMQKDWIIVGMKKIGDTAVLDCADERVIQKRIDVLLRAG
jgi:hypothetical protein